MQFRAYETALGVHGAHLQGGESEARTNEVDHSGIRLGRRHDAGRLQKESGATATTATTAAGGSNCVDQR